MKNMKFLLIAILMTLSLSSMNAPEEWTMLLDNDLSHWQTYLSYRHKIGYNGALPKDDYGTAIEPIGYNKDETHVFSVIQDNGELTLRISGEVYGCIFTKQEYENFHLKLKVKWGDRKDDPRKDKLRDSGILYYSTGEAGIDYWRSWMLSQEMQIMEGHMGDFWCIANSAIDIRAYLPEGAMNSVANSKQPYLSFGEKNQVGFCLRSENYESPPGEWTTIELICFQGKSLHIVNGHVVMILKNSRFMKDGQSVPLTKGKIQIQSEAAEVFYKDIRIRNLTSLPKKYSVMF